MASAREHFEAGRLGEAITAMNGEVKGHPADADRRGFLGELLCLAGNLDRADLQFDTIAQQEPRLAVGVSLIRQLIRGEQARRQFFVEGRLPELLGPPPEHLRLHIEASVLLREGAVAKALALLTKAEQIRPRLAGQSGEEAFDDFRDLDDLTAGFFEVLTSTGKYYVIPAERVISIEFRPIERPRDLLWRRAQMVVQDGPDGEVFLPATYPPPAAEFAAVLDDAARLGRKTEWVGGDDQPVRGVGQRCFLLGEESFGILQLERLDFSPVAG